MGLVCGIHSEIFSIFKLSPLPLNCPHLPPVSALLGSTKGMRIFILIIFFNPTIFTLQRSCRILTVLPEQEIGSSPSTFWKILGSEANYFTSKISPASTSTIILKLSRGEPAHGNSVIKRLSSQESGILELSTSSKDTDIYSQARH